MFRRGKYAGGKKVGKGNVANVGDTVKKGQTLGYVEQLGTFVDVKVGARWCVFWRGISGPGLATGPRANAGQAPRHTA